MHGRSGFDSGACVVGDGQRADEIQIRTVVDGVMTWDPSMIRDVCPLPRLRSTATPRDGATAFGALRAINVCVVSQGSARTNFSVVMNGAAVADD